MRKTILGAAAFAALFALDVQAACRGAWGEGNTYQTGDVVSYNGVNYSALTTHTAYAGANWNPAATPTLWKNGGSCGATPVPTPGPTVIPTVIPTLVPTATPVPATPKPTATPAPTATPVPTLVPTATPTVTPTPAGPVGACYPAWASGTAYNGGALVQYNGRVYKAKWWTQGDIPASNAGDAKPWQDLGACGGVTAVPTATPIPTLTPSATPVPSATPRPSVTPTIAPTATPTAIPTLAPTATPVPSATPVPTLAPTVTPAPSVTPVPGSWVLQNTFENDAIGLYSASAFQADWGVAPQNSTGVAAGRLSIVSDPDNGANKALRVAYKAGQVGGDSAMTFDAPLSGTYKSLWLQYKLRFDNAFNWVKGGKLPGLGGGDTPTGCIANGTFDGFTTRMMWRENGVAFSYQYYPGKKEECGDYYAVATRFKPGVWYTLTQQVIINDAGASNGEFRQWVDGVLVLQQSGLLFRNAAAVGVSAIKMDTFFGGSSTDWAPATDQYAYFDDFRVSTSSPLALVDTAKPVPPHSDPINGYSQWQGTGTYQANALVFRIDGQGAYHYYKARGYTAANVDPLTNSLLDIYYQVYSPIKLDTAQKWIELTAPWQ
ncbi:Chitodextrinase [Andreprevotia sp. IGB-42]|uniref:polysaccharide lyase n=1 Tax=Andreprevotia sp. IGB-42 TaxID=2497473 RepID=UPI00135681E4|nr:carbohydrate-binding protein [Andreprevotia sp. IGB-42]KAF0814063.1 Chitodextrinase [Andreprevotia sp. IGB-42]